MALFRRRTRVERLRARSNVKGLGKLLARREIHIDAETEALDLDGAEKEKAAEALGESGDPRAVALLSDGLASPDPRVRASIIRALASMPMREARLALVAAIATPQDVTVTPGGSLALQEVAGGYGDVTEELVSHLVLRDDDLVLGAEHEAAVGALLDTDTGSRERASDLLLGALGHADERVRQRAHQLLTLMGRTAVEPAIEALGAPESRKEAVKALGSLRSTAGVEPLLPLLEDENPQIRSAAAWALGEIKDPRAVHPLAQTARDADYDVRIAAMAALNGFGSVAIMIHLEGLVGGMTARELQENGQAERPALPQTVTERPPEGSQRPPEGSQRPPEVSQRPPEGSQRPPEGSQRPSEGSRLSRVVRAALDRDT